MVDRVNLVRSDGLFVCRALVASSFWTRLRGLMGAAGLPARTGLLFPRTSSVHTHFMRFPIDVVFLDDERRIVALRAALRPWRFAVESRARTVLELGSGECERLGLAAGDVLTAA